MFCRNLAVLQFSRLNVPSVHQIPNRGGKVQVPLSKSPPLPHMRRLLEAVSQPILSTDPKVMLQKPAALRCKRSVMEEENRKRMMELSPRELAYRNYLRKHLLEATVVILCHEHPTDTRLQHYDLMEMASKGIALIRQQSPKVVRSALRETTLEPFAAFFDDDVETLTSLMFTKRYVKEEDDGRLDIVSGKIRDRNYLPLALRCAKQTNWVVPLAVAYEDRMLTVNDAEKIVSMMKNPLQVRAETVAILNSPMVESVRVLNDHSSSLSSALHSRMEQLKANEQ